MRRYFTKQRRFQTGVLVTVVTSAALWSCEGDTGSLCPPGVPFCNDRDPDPTQWDCFPPSEYDPTRHICVPPNSCAGMTCPLPPGATEVEAVAHGAACVCEAARCEASYELQYGACVERRGCSSPGYVQEGWTCVLDEGVSCYELPQAPLCIPPRCDDPNFGSGVAQDGTDLVAEGKCFYTPPPPVESCVTNCHGGIEDPHPWYGGVDLTCTGCHGGNAVGSTRETAHVPLPGSWQQNSPQFGRPNLRYYWNYNTLYGVENFDGGLEWLRFRNPADLRVADQSCGRNSACHDTRVENVRRSVMAVGVGLTGVANMRSGVRRSVVRDGDAVYKWDNTEGMALGSGSLEAVTYDSEYTGSVRALTGFEIENREYGGVYRALSR